MADTSSPCVKVCIVDPRAGLCIGCGRTLAEISLWPEMAEAERIALMAALPARLSQRGRTRALRARPA